MKFIVVGALLAGLLIGGIYLVKKYPVQQPALPVGQTPKPPEVAQAPLPVEAEPTPAKPAELPTTGPKDTIGSMLVLGLLVAVIMSYIRSRRPQLSL